jgi:lipopolysaccharide/colanic/teichoic acid biosynthesis glycosyltransferase
MRDESNIETGRDRADNRSKRWDLSGMSDVLHHTARVAELARASGLATGVVDVDLHAEIAHREHSFYFPLSDVLPKQHFLKQLHREKSRTDRSKAPLSVAIFTAIRGEVDLSRLLEVLCAGKRETDTIGCLTENQFAVLLPETDAWGAARLAQKILERVGETRVSAVTRTYPDQLFDNLIAQRLEVPDLFPLLPEEASSGNGGYTLKRLVDVAGATLALVLLSPVMLVTAIAVAASSPGPVIFRQVRLGRRGAPFVFYKFRSMYCDADDKLHREYIAALISGSQGANQGDAEKPLYKLKLDPRITPLGRLLRKTSLDELPQLFSVLKGDMSLVGPRPPLPYEVEKYQSWHLRRILEVRPGITGLWQVEGRSRTSFDEMVRLDLRYIRSCSLAFDLKLLLKTIRVVLGGDGAR